MTEPVPPAVSTFADRLYSRLPDVYRRMDVGQAWLLKRYIDAATYTAGQVETVVDRIRGSRPAGPATPQPWGLVNAGELGRWVQARATHPSELGDPQLADEVWLPWLASLVGAHLDPAATVPERRDTIQYATSGWRAGTRGAIADAARSALEGSRYATVMVHTKVTAGALVAGSMWDITVITRASETPDPGAVLGAILRKGVKPAGAVLWTHTFSAGWDTVEALYPTWADWEAATWTQIEEAGLTYADVPDNLAVNPSFEAGTTGWTAAGGAAVSQQTGGIDAPHLGRLTSGDAVTAATLAGTALIAGINDDRTYHLSMSVKPHVALPGTAALEVDWHDVGDTLISTTSVPAAAPNGVGEWSRPLSLHLAPTTATQARIRLVAGALPVGEYVDVDAVLFRLT